MWYLVNLPGNKLTSVAVKTEKNSIAADCLNKVCHDLGIICETDYFGLLYAPSSSHVSSKNNIKQWINLRNPLEKRHNHREPSMLELRVKFWVPAHLILQENVREIFYMQARQMLLDGEIFPTDWKQAARFIALIAQAEGVKFVPDLLSASGQKIISDFWQHWRGIKLARSKSIREDKRNSIEEMKVDYCGGGSNNTIEDDDATGKYLLETYLENMIYLNDIDSPEDDFLLTIVQEHQKIQSMTQSSAHYWVLEEFSTLDHFGEENFHGTLISENEEKIHQTRNEKIQIAVNPQGLNVKKLESNQTFSIPFGAVESAKSIRRCFHLCYLNENFNTCSMVIKFPSHHIAGTLYRALTEKHSFYSCETVHKNVETQFIRDLKGTIVSMFNEDTTLGKKYVFDIRLTFRELYDNSRRILHSKGVDTSAKIQATTTEEIIAPTTSNMTENDAKRIDLTCSICMDRKIDTLFLPCAHLSCCKLCAQKCEMCPLCRQMVVQTSTVYFT